MKKTYSSPVVIVVEMDADEVCQAQVMGLSNGSSLGDQVPEGDDDDNQFAPTYRTNLWN